MADESYSNVIAEQGEPADLGSAIQELIKSNIINTNTAKIAQITAINGNKISFKPAMKRNADDAVMVVNNVMVAFQYSGEWQEQFKLKVGDFGVVIIIQDDISTFKNSGKGGECNTKRFKDINDAIFIPCSLYKTLNNSSINYILKNTGGDCLFEFDNSKKNTLKANEIESISAGNHTLNASSNVTINAGANADFSSGAVTNISAGASCNISGANVTISSNSGASLKGLLSNLADLLEKMAGGDTSDGATTAPASVGDFSGWKSSLNNLFG